MRIAVWFLAAALAIWAISWVVGAIRSSESMATVPGLKYVEGVEALAGVAVLVALGLVLWGFTLPVGFSSEEEAADEPATEVRPGFTWPDDEACFLAEYWRGHPEASGWPEGIQTRLVGMAKSLCWELDRGEPVWEVLDLTEYFGRSNAVAADYDLLPVAAASALCPHHVEQVENWIGSR